MFDILQRFRRPHDPSAAIRQALVRDARLSHRDLGHLAVVDQHGSYSGRSVNFFRAFDTERAAASGLQVTTFADLDDHPDLLVGSGHVERDGSITLSYRDAPERPLAAPRQSADRGDHADDDQFVFHRPQP